jgi:hypothetical protein
VDRPAPVRDRSQRGDTPLRAVPDLKESSPGDDSWAHAREDLAHFDPARAGLPDVPRREAERYIEANRGDRPWLGSAQGAPEDVQRVFTALDLGGGHAHIRHEGWLSMEKSQLRVLGLQDPAQLDPAKRAAGKDGLLPGDKQHYCAAMSTAIRDRAAFAVAFARGTEHPDIRAVLDAIPKKGQPSPEQVALPIDRLLGPDGHQACEGYRLAGDDERLGRQNRRTWLREDRAGSPFSVAAPTVTPVDFRGGNIEFRFKINDAGTAYEISTMYPAPPDQAPDQ